MALTRPKLTESQIRLGAKAGIVHVVAALILHFVVPESLEDRLGLGSDPWFRRETGTVNAGFAYGLIRLLQGHRDVTFLRVAAVSALLMATVRTAATFRGQRRGPLSAMVIASDVLLGVGGIHLANQFNRETTNTRS
ncbi:hypothetical protein ACNQVK_24830 [Mycobacterium sp. 134]|uniref:hypothetical protein n=1 Tax=Mycobacterium sp. 134 TaxID=3400425 RepID=UPI003AACB0F4